ncbi:MAG: hypothetical protein HQL69_22835 [Magnetococcales bacterium]|nr:hypothetical protein [Magnetococcales bacterium]
MNHDSALVDNNILFDIYPNDPERGSWPGSKLARIADCSRIIINPIILGACRTFYGETLQQIDYIDFRINSHFH